MVRNYQIGILFLLAVPFVAVATVGYFAVRGKRRLDEERRRALELANSLPGGAGRFPALVDYLVRRDH